MDNGTSPKDCFVNWLTSSMYLNVDDINEHLTNIDAIGICYSKYLGCDFDIWHISNSSIIDDILRAYDQSLNTDGHFPIKISKSSLLIYKKYLSRYDLIEDTDILNDSDALVVENSRSTSSMSLMDLSDNEDELDYKETLDRLISFLKEKYSTVPAKTLRQVRDENKDLNLGNLYLWTKKAYGVSAGQYLIDQGIVVPKEEDIRPISERLREVTEILLERYKDEKAKNLSQITKENQDLSISLINQWAKELFNQTAKVYLVEKGIIIQEENKEEHISVKLDRLVSELKSRYSDIKAKSLSQVYDDNPDLPVYMIYTWVKPLFDKTAKEYLIEVGIIEEDCVETDEQQIKLDTMMDILKNRYAVSKAVSVVQIKKDNPDVAVSTVSSLVKKLYNKTLKEYFIEQGILSPTADTASNSDISRQPKWDMYEAAILIDAYYRMKNQEKSRNDVIFEVSELLRQRACNKGLVIDSVYRNHNGISMRLSELEYIDNRSKSGLKNTSHLFRDMMALYAKDQRKFSYILREAYSFMNDEDNSDSENDSLNDVTVFVPEEIKGIRYILTEKYKYGYKCDSIRELIRFRQFAESEHIALPSEDEVLIRLIKNSGFLIDGKVYVHSKQFSEELLSMVEEAFQSGNSVIYYLALYNRNYSWMESHYITSEDLLKEYLLQIADNYTHSKRFMSEGAKKPEKEIVTSELIRVWGGSPKSSVDELSRRLPYIPKENIWRVISGNDMFVLTSEGEYLNLMKFNISQEDKKHIIEYVRRMCSEQGFASINELPLGSIEEDNYEIPRSAVYSAIYKKILSSDYCLNGKVLTLGKSDVDAVILLKEYISTKDECLFSEVEDKLFELIGATNRQYVFQALYDCMVRVDKNRYVAEKYVKFNIADIDKAISSIMKSSFTSLHSITTFATFPFCGQSWNLYLLGSFCYRFSRKYDLRVLHHNDKNAGIIVEKNYNKTYKELLAIVLSDSDVELDVESAGAYLSENGYLAKRKYGGLPAIVEMASRMRKEKEQ